jgi:polynucleotide 5'-kinase involved in rRNA processing
MRIRADPEPQHCSEQNQSAGLLFENMKTTALFRPMVMLVGQYSTGKTTFIRYLLEQDFPGIRIGPEPTTDRYVVL